MDRIKHLGNNITNTMDGYQYDVRVKAARYIDKCNSLSQEFHFSHPVTKVHINSIYNSHFTGSQLWGMDSSEIGKLESTYNKSIKLMFGLPLQTHRYFIEPLTDQPHLKKQLLRRYMTFFERIESSKKRSLKMLLKLSKTDVRTTTGRNLRYLMISLGKRSVDEIRAEDIDSLEYNPIQEDQSWRVSIVKELIDVREKECEVQGFTDEELEEIINHVCTS